MNEPIKYLFQLSPKEKEEIVCKGVFFRGYNNIFFSGGRLEQKRGYRLLKRKSCPGCSGCTWLRDEALIEEASNSDDLSVIKDYGLYELSTTTTGGGRSWDGYDDCDYELKFNLVEEK